MPCATLPASVFQIGLEKTGPVILKPNASTISTMRNIMLEKILKISRDVQLAFLWLKHLGCTTKVGRLQRQPPLGILVLDGP